MRRKTNVLHYQVQSIFDWAWFCSQKPSAKLLLNIWYRFSAFWLRSKCSICSYQLNIWYEVHRTSSILNWFLDGDGVSVACYGSIKCWPCIAVPQGSAHFPTNNPSFSVEIHQFMWTCKKSEWYQGLEFIIQCAHDYMTCITPIFKNCCIV